MGAANASLTALFLAATVIACAERDEDPPPPRISVSLGPGEISSAADLAQDELERWRRERLEQYRDALDPGELAEHVRYIAHSEILDGSTPLEMIFLQGEDVFERSFTLAEGLGAPRDDRPAPGLSRVQRARAMGGPDARSCRECHFRGGDDGHGELHQRAWLDGDGRRLSSAAPRVPPILIGGGVIQAVAAEMSADLAASLEIARTSPPGRYPLVSKGVSFGHVVVLAGGGIDLAEVRGVDPDLIVKPFGWKGVQPTLRAFIRRALPQHMGLEPLPAVESPESRAALASIGVVAPVDAMTLDAHGYLFDGDGDRRAHEVTEGQLTSLAIYLALLDIPVILPPRTAAAHDAWSRGAAAFDAVGCAGCHLPELELRSPLWLERSAGTDPAFTIDLVKDNQVAPGLAEQDLGRRGYRVRLYSDLRRHDLGPGLAERQERSVAPTEWLTRPLWGIAGRTYFLHDGRARSFDEAIRLHGGEAADAAAAYAALPLEQQRAVQVFLLSLGRTPQGRFAP